jgi:hypothetical protein
MRAGQAIVQFCKSKFTDVEYAMKFAISSTTFAQEEMIYSSPLGKLIPGIKHINRNDDRSFADIHGIPLPPCIVMEKGESFDHYSERAKPDIFGSIMVRAPRKQLLRRVLASFRIIL